MTYAPTVNDFIREFLDPKGSPSVITAPVWWTGTLSCGCFIKKSLVQNGEAAGPGQVIICDKHNEWAIVTRVTLRLVDDATVIKTLFVKAGVDSDEAGQIMAEQGLGR